MKQLYKVCVLAVIVLLFNACNEKEKVPIDEIPENVIEMEGIYHVWNWMYTLNVTTPDSLYPTETAITYTFDSTGVLHEKEDDYELNKYNFYITSETKDFDGKTYNKIYYFLGSNKTYEKYITLTSPSRLIVRDYFDYGWIIYFEKES